MKWNCNNIEMYLAYNERKSVVAERFIRTLKNVHIDKLNGTTDTYNDA